MKTRLATAIASICAAGLLMPNVSVATGFADFQQAITDGDANVKLRYRYERVDQDNVDKDANASTLLTRLGYKSADFGGFYTQIEFDNVTALGNENFNSTVNGNTNYPVVADPIGSDFNQAYVGFKTESLHFTAGRQRINHNDERFVGGVGWRQNEQTYDGYRLRYDNQSGLNVDYSYIHNVNRIFGTDSPNSDLGGNIHLLNVTYKINADHKVAGFAYELDFDTANAIATRTLGVSYDGKVSAVNIHAAYARQNETGDNPTDFSTDYLALELSTKLSAVNVGIGYESLGSDNGKGFTTPLATLHKFQGFADKFLATPGQGINDLYIKASGSIGKLKLLGVWHQFESDVGSIDYGDEFNFNATYPVYKNTNFLLRYANYSADDFAVDTNKLWAMMTFTF